MCGTYMHEVDVCDYMQARVLERASGPSQAAAVKQGLHLIEQVHQLGGADALHLPVRLPGTFLAGSVDAG